MQKWGPTFHKLNIKQIINYPCVLTWETMNAIEKMKKFLIILHYRFVEDFIEGALYALMFINP